MYTSFCESFDRQLFKGFSITDLLLLSAAMLGLFFVSSAFGVFVNEVFRTRIGNLLSFVALMTNVSSGLFGTFVQTDTIVRMNINGVLQQTTVTEPPLWASWTMLFLICAVCLALLSRKLKAYEVVK